MTHKKLNTWLLETIELRLVQAGFAWIESTLFCSHPELSGPLNETPAQIGVIFNNFDHKGR